ncbi:hypothetical protein Tco_1185150 [Tanacetum coccineum]
MMITTTSRIEDKNLLGLILPKNTMETSLYVQDAPTITQACSCQVSNLQQSGLSNQSVVDLLSLQFLVSSYLPNFSFMILGFLAQKRVLISDPLTLGIC